MACPTSSKQSNPSGTGFQPVNKVTDRQDRQSYLRWCGEWASEIKRILKINGSLFLNIGAAPSNPMLPHEIVFQLCDLFVLQNAIHWIKSISVPQQEALF